MGENAMSEKQLDRILPFLRALAQGKKVEWFCNSNKTWLAIGSGPFSIMNEPDLQYRIVKPLCEAKRGVVIPVNRNDDDVSFRVEWPGQEYYIEVWRTSEADQGEAFAKLLASAPVLSAEKLGREN